MNGSEKNKINVIIHDANDFNKLIFNNLIEFNVCKFKI